MAVQIFYKDIDFTNWQNGLAVILDQIIQHNSFFYQVTIAGNLGTSPPTQSLSPQANGTATLQRLSTQPWTDIGSVTADSTCNLYIVNKTSSSGNFKLAIYTSGLRTEEHFIFYDFPIKSKGTFILTDVILTAGETVSIDCPQNFTVRMEAKGLA